MTSATSDAAFTVRDLARPSGAFAMVAVDQREAMRAMFAEHRDGPVEDAVVTDFKLNAIRVLSPFASAILLDRQFVWDRAIASGVTAPRCGLIAAADTFIPGPNLGEFVDDVAIDEAVEPAVVRRQGARALKLLVIWRRDGDPDARIEMVRRFVARCRSAGLVAIIEPVARAPRDGRSWDWDEDVLAAARELGDVGADLYKAEMPLRGEGDATLIARRCGALTETVASPWVVLSSGVAQDAFPRAVEIACRNGASGFLAGRAIWRAVIGEPDVEAALVADALPRLRRLCELVDRVVAR